MKVAIVMIVYVLLSLFVQQISYADEKVLEDLERQLLIDKEQVQMTVTHYGNIKEDMIELIGHWSATSDQIDKSLESALLKGSIAIVGAVTVYATGGTALAYSPALFLAYMGTIDAGVALSVDLTNYLDAMDTVSSLMDDALGDIQTAYVMGGTLILPKVDKANGNQLYNDDGTLTHYEPKVRGYLNTYKKYMKAGAAYMGLNADDETVVNALF